MNAISSTSVGSVGSNYKKTRCRRSSVDGKRPRNRKCRSRVNSSQEVGRCKDGDDGRKTRYEDVMCQEQGNILTRDISEDWESIVRSVGEEDNYLAIDVLFNNKEKALSDDQFIKNLNSDELLLSEEIEEWKKKYHLDEGELEKGSAAILKGEIDLTKEGLTERQLNDVKTRIKTLQHLPLPELLDYVRLCTFD